MEKLLILCMSVLILIVAIKGGNCEKTEKQKGLKHGHTKSGDKIGGSFHKELPKLSRSFKKENRTKLKEGKKRGGGKKMTGILNKFGKVVNKLNKLLPNTNKEGKRNGKGKNKAGEKNGNRRPSTSGKTKQERKAAKKERKKQSKEEKRVVKNKRRERRRGFRFSGSIDFMKRMDRRLRRKKTKEIQKLETDFMEKENKKDRKTLKSFLKECSSLLKKIKKRKKRRRKEKQFGLMPTSDTEEEDSSSFQVLGTINTFGMRLAEDMGWAGHDELQSIAVDSDDIAMEVSTIRTNFFTGVTIPTKELADKINDSITFPEKLFRGAKQGNGTIISSFYEAFEEMYNATDNSTANSTFVNSQVVSAEVNPPPEGELEIPVKIIFKNLVESPSHVPSCVYWDYNKSDTLEGGWASKGCFLHKWNRTHTECHCNHLTDFAVLFRASDGPKADDVHYKVLGVISLIGCIISIVGLTLTLLTLIFLKKLLRSERNVIHFNLVSALLIANVIFVFADKALGKKIPCFIVTLALFYFFLCAFAWMLVEGIQIWILLTQVFEGGPRLVIYHLVGWGFPAVVVAISGGVFQYDIMSKNFCWLSTAGAPIWTFIGPAVLIMAINLVVLAKALYLTYKHNQDKEGVGSVRTAAKCCLILMPILGFTWIFGIFTLNGEMIVFQYLFTIFNSLQGLFIFIFYVLFNVEVQREYKSLRRKQKESQSIQQRLTTSSSAGSRVDRKNDKSISEMHPLKNVENA